MNRWEVGEAGWQVLPRRWKQRLSMLAAICIVVGSGVAPDLSQHLLQRASDSYLRHKVQPRLDRLQHPPATSTIPRVLAARSGTSSPPPAP